MDQAADLQTQIVALRIAVEGLWLSLLANDPDPVGQAEALKRDNVALIGQLAADTDQAKAARDAVIKHTEHLWNSIGWQLDRARERG